MDFRYRVTWMALLVTAVVMGTACSAIDAFAGAGGAGSWRVVARVAGPGRTVALVSVASAGPAQAWAVGGNNSGADGDPVLERWSGHRWARVTLGKSVQAELGQSAALVSVSSAGPRNSWAVNSDGGWLHWNGSRWSAGQDINPDVTGSVLAVGRASAWIFGANLVGSGYVPYAAYRAGGAWRSTRVPGTSPVVGASGVSSGDIWAVLGTGRVSGPAPGGSLIRWQDGRWRTVGSFPASMRNPWLGSVRAFSDRDVWVGGAVRNGRGGYTEAVGHWNGRRWSVSRLKASATVAPFAVTSLASDGSGGLWALGICLDSAKCPRPPGDWRLWHESRGQWSTPIRPRLASGRVLLFALAAAGRSLWAAGAASTGSGHADGLIALRGETP